jgi:predicted Rossmann fold nucleotide-binding protein DprA/Smf involved in DNA uptake
LERLLARGFLLSQAIERWQARAIWVLSRADADYPTRLKQRLKEYAPPVLYGCGERAILDAGGLAVVGSRNVDESLVSYTENIGRLAAAARCVLISGGARGIDQAAMRGALDGGGKVAGVLADSLERAALARECREAFMDGHLVLVSPYDPLAGFNVGQAMQRNKSIYALADAALVVSCDEQKGGTWAGAIEQLDKLKLVPVYVRPNGANRETGQGLVALQRKGALTWPDPTTPEELRKAFAVSMPPAQAQTIVQESLPLDAPNKPDRSRKPVDMETIASKRTPAPKPSDEDAFAKARKRLERGDAPKTESQVAEELGVSKPQAHKWLLRLVEEGVLEKLPKPKSPIRYRSTASFGPLFDQQD